MKARTLAALVVSYNSTRGRYIVTVTQPVLEYALHRADDCLLAVWRDNVVQNGPPGGRAVTTLHAAMGARERQRLEGQAIVANQWMVGQGWGRPPGC